MLVVPPIPEFVPAELQELTRIGCTINSTAFELFDKLKGRLSRGGKYDDALDKAADLFVEKFGITTVKELQLQPRQRCEYVFTTAELPGAWVDTLGSVLGVVFDEVGVPGGTPASAALGSPPVMTQIGHDKRLFKAQASLGKSLIAAGQLESRGRLPLRIFDAIKECADYKRYALTYNDMRAVTTEIWLWVVATFGVSSIDIEFARHIEKQLVAKILSLPPGRRHGWAKIIMLRFENGNRSNAAVRHAPPSHNPFRARAHPRPRPSARP